MANGWHGDDFLEINKETLEKIVNHSSDEIFVLDADKRIVFVNQKCEEHYGVKPGDVVGKNNAELVEKGYWTPSLVDIVFEKKQPITIQQSTFIKSELITTAVPILNRENDIELVVCTSQELQRFKTLEITSESISQQNNEPEHNLIFTSEKMRYLIKQAKKAAAVNSTVLIQGESGTGKGLIANLIHQQSHRQNNEFLTINCAAIPEDLLESELFGYTSGAFTGARNTGKKGLIESANHGTVFLDEIGDMPLKLQPKLLQLIQDQEFIPVGGHETKKVDVRILAATNNKLDQLVAERKFREDLYYRLNVIELEVPSLRERPEDITPLIHYFLNIFNKKHKGSRLISNEAMNLLSSYSWPGNIRQLQNIIERSVIMAESIIRTEDLPPFIRHHQHPMVQAPVLYHLDQALEEIEKDMVLRSYQRYTSTRKVASDLGISQTRASKLINKYKGYLST
ncbi:sigma-54 interaction domain-containing protein [Lentibacillus juripiscarius]|uniref:HTH-type transcriptional regulatory protein TyrR n=1 Tax=Lentibacillus juripiscarius TaxID=257446 RepID=A0ABW5V739_9BACI